MAQTDTQPVPPFRGRATIRDIADLAGVSIATVSRVLNDRPDVARETRESVLQVVREHGFSTNRGARGLSSGRTGMIGLTLPLVADAYFGPMLSGAAEALHERDMRLVLAPTLHEHDREVSLLERLMRGTTDGAILMLPEESADELLMLQRAGLPVRGRRPARAAARRHRVRLGDARGRSEAGDRASARARPPPHRRDRRRPGWYATEERLIGFRAALAGAGMLLDPELVAYSDWRMPRGTEAAEQLLSLADPPTAIFGFNDNVAIGALHAAHKRGFKVPDDLSVVGFDDTELAIVVTPQLTSVRQPLAELGRTGVSPARSRSRRAAGGRAAHGAGDEARRARDDGPAAAEIARCARDRRGSTRRRPCDRSCVRARRRDAKRVPRAAAGLGPAGACGALRRAPGERLGARREPDRAVVDGERGELDEHAVLGRRTQAAADGSGRRRPDRGRVVCRQAASASRRAASPTPRASSTPARTGSCARGRRPCRRGGRPSHEVVVDEGADGGGLPRCRDRTATGSYATDFHNARVNVYDAQWHRLRLPGAFVDERSLPGTRRSGSRRSTGMSSSRTSSAHR